MTNVRNNVVFYGVFEYNDGNYEPYQCLEISLQVGYLLTGYSQDSGDKEEPWVVRALTNEVTWAKLGDKPELYTFTFPVELLVSEGILDQDIEDL